MAILAIAATGGAAVAQSVTATATAASMMTARAGADQDSRPPGASLTNGLLLMAVETTSFPPSSLTARTDVALAATGATATYTIGERSTRSGLPGGVATTGTHRTVLTLASPGPVRGVLRVRYERTGSPTGDTTASIDIGNDTTLDWVAPFGNGTFTWSTPVTFEGSLEVATTTGSSASFATTSDGELTIEFVRTKRVVLPDDMHLSNGPTIGEFGGSVHWWYLFGLTRVQILFDAEHFLDAGITGPIDIERIAFRGADGWVDPGGHTFEDVEVVLAATSLDYATLTQTFAQNLSPTTTTVGNTAVLDVVEAPSLGTTPNNDHIAIDVGMAGAGITFDPTGPRPHLLVTLFTPFAPTIPPGATRITTQQSWSPTAAYKSYVRGVALYTHQANGINAQVETAPPVLAVEFRADPTTAGGYDRTTPARNESFGAACGGQPSTFYQAFRHGQQFDLQAGLTLTPDTYPSPSVYTVTAGAPPVDATQLNASPQNTSYQEVVPHQLGFQFSHPGGTTNEIGASTAGIVHLVPGVSSAGGQVWREFLLATPINASVPYYKSRLCPLWTYLHGIANRDAIPNSGVHVRTSGTAPNRICYVTWWRIAPLHGSAAATATTPAEAYDFQCAIHEATGVVEFRYGNTPTAFHGYFLSEPAIVGYTRGQIGGTTPSLDPQSRDLSHEVPFTTHVEGSAANMGLHVESSNWFPYQPAYYGHRLYFGTGIRWRATNVPAGSQIGVFLLDFTASMPGINIPGIHAPGCLESTTLSPLLFEVIALPASTVTSSQHVLAPGGYQPGLIGFDLIAQFACIDLSGNGPIVTATSNAIRHTLGLQ